ncbi:type IV pilus assembly protein PilN [Rhodoferax ferrireducens]|uniref:Type IV pilus assembly protein PilN n=1 Tax=Rhodoferax ferrireducens TaxID=192843 RepID=A0ABU2CFK7_9BURK|nr:PilN domain-containing protein [Rhodoferax ferrireducens]MDR7380116.1 type IV pilus assembly protein PilN [Rhodoferax ferrireducens]
MILINLLPHREAARARRRETFNVMLAASALLGGVLIGVGFLWYEAQISGQQERNAFLNKEIAVLDGQIKEIANIEAEIKALTERQKAVEDLQADRNLPVHLLNELVKQLPDGTYITSLKQENQSVTIQGVAQSNERVSELLRNLANNTPWLSRPDLVEIVASTVSLSPRDQRRVAKFNLRVRLMRSSEVQKAGETAATAAVATP